MIDCKNINEDMKVLFINSGYLTQDDSCGYDELIFAVRKKYLLKWLNAVSDHKVDEDEMERWLSEEYTSDDSHALYVDAKREKEIVFSAPVWNTNRMKYYEVSEFLRSDGEYEDKVFCRTMDYESAKEVYEKEKNAVIEDENFFLRGFEPEISSYPEGGEMSLHYEDEDGNYYTLQLTGVEVEKEGR